MIESIKQLLRDTWELIKTIFSGGGPGGGTPPRGSEPPK